jgi:hypothetical protein
LQTESSSGTGPERPSTESEDARIENRVHQPTRERGLLIADSPIPSRDRETTCEGNMVDETRDESVRDSGRIGDESSTGSESGRSASGRSDESAREQRAAAPGSSNQEQLVDDMDRSLRARRDEGYGEVQ